MGIDLLLTGPAHSKTLRENLLGSTVARIVHYVNLPGLAVHRRVDGPYATDAAGIDFSAGPRSALQTGMALFPTAWFTQVHAYQISADWGGHNVDRPVDVIEVQGKERVIYAAEQELSELIGSAGHARDNNGFVLQEGEPETVVADYVDKHWPDLVIAGTHGRTGEQHAP